ncbi:MAG TPA: ribosomal protein S18-alanine N-acetyltransferase [Thermodesulfobacteriota bacterium]|nr:ribosomal protein S18-alanine N-acetyltransferase [Thermodesulfobacteriota bacterium]
MASAPSPLPIEIVPLTRDNLAEVVRIEARSFSQPWSREVFLRELKNRWSSGFVAYLPGADGRWWAAGYVIAWLVVGEVHILNLAVDPAARRRGVGRALLVHVLKAFEAKGATKATLEVRRSNLAAQALYEGLGFVRVGVRRGYYSDNGEDAFVMTADVAEVMRRAGEEGPGRRRPQPSG